MESNYLLNNFNFEVTLIKSPVIESGSNTTPEPTPSGRDTLGDGGFQECSGLDIEMDIKELKEGGRNDGIIQQIGAAKYQNIILKRGMFYNDSSALTSDVWEWMQNVLTGIRPVTRYDGLIKVFGHRKKSGSAPEVIATWAFERALPVKISGPQLNAKSGDVAIEELHLAHEGLRMMI